MWKWLKPDLWKLLLTGALFFGSGLLWRMYVMARLSDTFLHGFPLPYYLGWGPCPPGEVCSEFNLLNLVLDFSLWYVVSAFLVERLVKKNTSP